MDTRTEMIRYMEQVDFLTPFGIAEAVGVSDTYFYKWLNSDKSKNFGNINNYVAEFLNGDGKRLIELTNALKNRAKNRIELHQQRAKILQKARIHVPSKHSVPSPALNN